MLHQNWSQHNWAKYKTQHPLVYHIVEHLVWKSNESHGNGIRKCSEYKLQFNDIGIRTCTWLKRSLSGSINLCVLLICGKVLEFATNLNQPVRHKLARIKMNL